MTSPLITCITISPPQATLFLHPMHSLNLILQWILILRPTLFSFGHLMSKTFSLLQNSLFQELVYCVLHKLSLVSVKVEAILITCDSYHPQSCHDQGILSFYPSGKYGFSFCELPVTTYLSTSQRSVLFDKFLFRGTLSTTHC